MKECCSQTMLSLAAHLRNRPLPFYDIGTMKVCRPIFDSIARYIEANAEPSHGTESKP